MASRKESGTWRGSITQGSYFERGVVRDIGDGYAAAVQSNEVVAVRRVKPDGNVRRENRSAGDGRFA